MPPTRPSVPTINPPRPQPTRTETVRTAATDRRFLYWLLAFVVMAVLIGTSVSLVQTAQAMLMFAGGSLITVMSLKLR
jgi:hypothetical protein